MKTNSKNCFVEGTEISMENGKTNIENIKKGEVVLSFNQKAKKIEPKKVLKIKQDFSHDLIQIEFEYGQVNKNTSNHRYLIDGEGWGSYNNYKLNKGDYVLDIDNDKVKVTNIQRIGVGNYSNRVYNLIVEDNENYYASGILVHCRNS